MRRIEMLLFLFSWFRWISRMDNLVVTARNCRSIRIVEKCLTQPGIYSFGSIAMAAALLGLEIKTC